MVKDFSNNKYDTVARKLGDSGNWSDALLMTSLLVERPETRLEIMGQYVKANFSPTHSLYCLLMALTNQELDFNEVIYNWKLQVAVILRNVDLKPESNDSIRRVISSLSSHVL